jgi:hypothetical protein
MTKEEATNFLKNLNFSGPIIEEYAKNNFKIEKIDGVFVFKQDGFQWMIWDQKTNEQVFNFYSHYCLAKGHVICTGMGFLLREKWLLSKPDVSKITVIEINKNIIEYHKLFNPDILRSIEVVNDNVYDFKGECDTLLIDNFEGDYTHEYNFLYGTKVICDNINHKVAWMWPMEGILNLHYKEYIGLSLFELYNNIKKYFDLRTFPNLNEEQLFDFCHKFFMGNFTKCRLEENK